MGFEEMGITQAEWDIAKIIETHVGYETQVQWRIAKALAVREQDVLAMQPVKTDVESHKALMALFDQVQMLAKRIDTLPRWRPLSRTKLVRLFNDAFGLETEKAPRWWRYKYYTTDKIDAERLAVVWCFIAAGMFLTQILVAYVKS